MELPLITLIDRMKTKPVGLSEDNGITIRGLRLLTPDTRELEPGVLYLGQSPPEKIRFNKHSCALFFCRETKTPYCSMFLDKADMDCTFNELLDIFALFQGYDDAVRSIIYEQRGIQALIYLCSEILGNPAYLVDSSFKVLAIDDSPMLSELSAIWKNLVTSRYLSYDIVSNLRKSDELKLMESYERAVTFESDYFYNTFINYNLRHKGKVVGHFFVVGYIKKITSGDVAYANYLGKMILLAMSNDVKYRASRGRDYENFFIHMLSGTLRNRVAIIKQLEPLGWDLDGRYTVLRMEPQARDELLMETLCSRLENMWSGKPLMWDDGIVAVFPSDNGAGTALMTQKLKELAADDGGRIGISDEFEGFYRLAAHYGQTKAALEFGKKNPGTLHAYRDYAVMHVLKAADEVMDLDTACEKSVFRLRDYDIKHSSDYLSTLEAYIDNERSIALTSEKLHIHRNTLLYRVNRLQEMLELDLDDISVRQRISLSFSVLEFKGITNK